MLLFPSFQFVFFLIEGIKADPNKGGPFLTVLGVPVPGPEGHWWCHQLEALCRWVVLRGGASKKVTMLECLKGPRHIHIYNYVYYLYIYVDT